MLEREISVLGMKGKKPFPSSSDEFNEIAKKQGNTDNDPCLGYANTYVQMHRYNADVRGVFLYGQDEKKNESGTITQQLVNSIGDITGIAPKEEAVVDKKTGKPRIGADGEVVTEFSEKEEVYLNRVIAELIERGDYADESEARASLQDHFNKVVEITDVNLGKTVRTGIAPKLAAKHKIFAAKVLVLGLLDKVNKTFKKTIGKHFEPTHDTSTMFTGKYPDKDKDGKPTEVEFSVSEKDANALGQLVKEWREYQEAQETANLAS